MAPLDRSIKLFKGFNGVWLHCEQRTVVLELERISVGLGACALPRLEDVGV